MAQQSSKAAAHEISSAIPNTHRLSGILFGLPWWLVTLALLLVWLIYMILVGTTPVVLARTGDTTYDNFRNFESISSYDFALGVVSGSDEAQRARDLVGSDRLREFETFEAAVSALRTGQVGGILVAPLTGQLYALNNRDTIALYSENFLANTFSQLSTGLPITFGVVIIAYTAAIIIGLIVGLIRSSPPKRGTGLIGGAIAILRLILYQIVTLYVAVLRGLPILVTLLATAFVLMPIFRTYVTGLGIELPRQLFLQAGIIALAVAYGAFLSETFRAGIQSIERGQIEAARSLGMSYFQVIRHIVLPQAVRRVLPPLGNDMIAMIKDTSLVSALGVNDITQIAKLWSATTFRYPEVLFVLAMIYLTMTVFGSLIVRWIENRMAIPGR
jgi:ABC-type amino acid transport system permease subunit